MKCLKDGEGLPGPDEKVRYGFSVSLENGEYERLVELVRAKHQYQFVVGKPGVTWVSNNGRREESLPMENRYVERWARSPTVDLLAASLARRQGNAAPGAPDGAQSSMFPQVADLPRDWQKR